MGMDAALRERRPLQLLKTDYLFAEPLVRSEYRNPLLELFSEGHGVSRSELPQGYKSSKLDLN